MNPKKKVQSILNYGQENTIPIEIKSKCKAYDSAFCTKEKEKCPFWIMENKGK